MLDWTSEVCNSESMSMEVWWSTLRPETRDWLIAHNGEAVPAAVVEEIARAGGSVTSDAWWVGRNGPTGFYFSDAAIDWVEEVRMESCLLPRNDDCERQRGLLLRSAHGGSARVDVRSSIPHRDANLAGPPGDRPESLSDNRPASSRCARIVRQCGPLAWALCFLVMTVEITVLTTNVNMPRPSP